MTLARPGSAAASVCRGVHPDAGLSCVGRKISPATPAARRRIGTKADHL